MKRVKINEELFEVSSHDELGQQIKDYAKRRGIETFFVEVDGRNVKESELEVRYFFKEKKFFALPPEASPYRVTKIILIVGLNTERFRNWKCLVQTPTGHPQVSNTSKELCAGGLRGKSLLESETIPAIIRLLEVPSLDSAYFQPEGLISCPRPPVWQV